MHVGRQSSPSRQYNNTNPSNTSNGNENTSTGNNTIYVLLHYYVICYTQISSNTV